MRSTATRWLRERVLQVGADLTAGHGTPAHRPTGLIAVSRPTGLIAVSAQDPDAVERTVADIEQAAIQPSCESLRRWGQQAQAFSTAALSLCRQV